MLLFGGGNLTKYHKAIRDKIPEIIKKSGNECNVKTLSDSEFMAELEEKVVELKKELIKINAQIATGSNPKSPKRMPRNVILPMIWTNLEIIYHEKVNV